VCGRESGGDGQGHRAADAVAGAAPDRPGCPLTAEGLVALKRTVGDRPRPQEDHDGTAAGVGGEKRRCRGADRIAAATEGLIVIKVTSTDSTLVGDWGLPLAMAPPMPCPVAVLPPLLLLPRMAWLSSKVLAVPVSVLAFEIAPPQPGPEKGPLSTLPRWATLPMN
jgi:hypothetical protein